MAFVNITINDLRTLSGLNPSEQYYSTDEGMEGFWYADGFGTLINDNTGTILYNSTNSQLFKRVFDPGFVNGKWFGAKGDGTSDDTSSIQAALDFISYTKDANPGNANLYGGGTVFLPKGKYLLTDTLLIGENCRLIGVNNRYHFKYYNGFGPAANGGTVLFANFSNPNKWVISSATFKQIPPTPLDFLPYNIALNSTSVPPSFEQYIYRMGINIENLTVDGGDNHAFGGIRLSNAGNSTVRNVGVFRTKCGFLVNTCWGGSIENCFTNFFWYGILVLSCNSFVINNSYTRKLDDGEGPLLSVEQLPEFILNENFLDFGLNDNVKFGKTGIFCQSASAIDIFGTVIELSPNGITILNSTVNLTSIYLEFLRFYGITIGLPINNEIQLNADQIYSYDIGSLFFFGNQAMANICEVDCFYRPWLLFSYANQLYEYNSAVNRNIIFTNVIYHKRKYFKDILFTDEGKDGQNLGAIFIDPDLGNDDNYGFNKNDTLKTFDEALIRVQNQSTINPVKAIYLKAAPVLDEFSDPKIGAVIKNLNIVSIENVDIEILPYDIDEFSTPQRLNGRIYFEGDTSDQKVAMIGQIELLGNVNLYLKDIDLICNVPLLLPQSPENLSIFGLKNSYGKLTFNNKGVVFPPMNIDLNFAYSLVQANIDLNVNVNPNSLLDIKFLNTAINGGSLSPYQLGNKNLGVDCVQIGSFTTGIGWQDAIIIRNNI